jgi:hypothetical protein
MLILLVVRTEKNPPVIPWKIRIFFAWPNFPWQSPNIKNLFFPFHTAANFGAVNNITLRAMFQLVVATLWFYMVMIHFFLAPFYIYPNTAGSKRNPACADSYSYYFYILPFHTSTAASASEA